MAKINIIFNNTNYSIDDISLSAAVAELKSHLSTTMAGSGAVINLGLTPYNVSSTKLAAATTNFVSHLRTISGNGYKVTIGGVEYNISADKLRDVISNLDVCWKDLGSPDSVEELENKYEFVYFSSMGTAVNAINNNAINNHDAEKETAVAAVYIDENEVANLVLLKDVQLSTRVSPSVDMVINLGGKTISCSDVAAIDIMSGTITIDGRIKGSAIHTVTTGSNMARAFQVRAGNVTAIGGTYTAYSETSNSCGVMSAGTLTISDAIILADGVGGANKGLQINAGSTATISNCNITSNTVSGNGNGILNSGTIVITDSTILAKTVTGKNDGLSTSGTATLSGCNVQAYSNYTVADGEYISSSKGINNTGTLTITDSYVYGTHSGLQNYGDLYINGGTYEGYGHGGLYFAGSNYTSYVQNANINLRDMPDGYLFNPEICNNAGFYIGGSDGKDKIIYMDGCKIVGAENTRQAFVLQSSYGSKLSTLYISNSTINEGARIRIDDNNKLYIGIGCNFTADDTNRPELVIKTNETYIMN